MCGRFFIDEGDTELRHIIAQMDRNEPSLHDLRIKDHGEIFPTDMVPVLTSESTGQYMQWGFIGYGGKGQLINARSETLLEKPTFRKPTLETRCLIPATNYFEWEKAQGKKIKYALWPATGAVLYMAGIYRVEKGSTTPRFVIITRDAADGIRFIHDRMPVILPPQFRMMWLKDGVEALRHAEQNIAHQPA